MPEIQPVFSTGAPNLSITQAISASGIIPISGVQASSVNLATTNPSRASDKPRRIEERVHRLIREASNNAQIVSLERETWASECVRDYIRSFENGQANHTLIHTCSAASRASVRSECQVQDQAKDIQLTKFGETYSVITKDAGRCLTHPFRENAFHSQASDGRHSFTRLMGANTGDCLEVFSEENPGRGTTMHVIVNTCDSFAITGDIVESCAESEGSDAFYVFNMGDARIRTSKSVCNAQEAIRLREPTTETEIETTTMSSTKPTAQASTAPTTEATTESTTNATTAPTTEATTESTTRATTEPTEATTESTTRATTAPTTEATTESSTRATTAPTTFSTTEFTTQAPVKLINNIHQPSMVQAVGALVKNEGRKVGILAKFSSKACQDKILTSVCAKQLEGKQLGGKQLQGKLLQGCPEYWQSQNAEVHAAILPLNRTQTTKLLGLSVAEFDCIEEISAETLNLYSLNKIRAQHEKVAELRAKLKTDSAEVCIASGTAVKFEGMHGQPEKIPQVKCMPKLTEFIEPSEDILNSPEATAAEKACISRLGLISDGIPIDSALNFSVAAVSIMGNNVQVEQGQAATAGKRFALSALRHCPNVKFDDCHASIKPSATNNLINPLQSHSVIQCLDKFSVQSNVTKPDKIVLVDPAELSSYAPNIEVINAYVKQLEKQSIPVLVYAASDEAWERGLFGVQQVENVDEVMQKR